MNISVHLAKHSFAVVRNEDKFHKFVCVVMMSWHKEYASERIDDAIVCMEKQGIQDSEFIAAMQKVVDVYMQKLLQK